MDQRLLEDWRSSFLSQTTPWRRESDQVGVGVGAHSCFEAIASYIVVISLCLHNRILFAAGRPWLARELRHKSSEDLHKLWSVNVLWLGRAPYTVRHYDTCRYVLLKERNMLMTIRQEANRLLFVMPGPERLRKVR